MICRYIASLTDDLSFYIEMYLLNGLLLLNYVMLFEKLHLRAIKPSILLRKKKKKSSVPLIPIEKNIKHLL